MLKLAQMNQQFGVCYKRTWPKLMLTKICFGLLSRVVNISTLLPVGEIAMLGTLLYHIIYCIHRIKLQWRSGSAAAGSSPSMPGDVKMNQKYRPTPVCEFRCDLALGGFAQSTAVSSPINAVRHVVSSVANSSITVEGEPLFEEPGSSCWRSIARNL